jgi:hypothetical protein
VEQSYREQLRILGFDRHPPEQALPESAGELFEMVNDSAWLTFTLNELPKLRTQGWELQIDEDFGFDLTAVDDWYATVEQAPERDWFDLELGIIVNGERLSLLPILLNLMRSHTEILNPERLARRRDDELILVNIPQRNSEHGPLQGACPWPTETGAGDPRRVLPAGAGRNHPAPEQGRRHAPEPLEDLPCCGKAASRFALCPAPARHPRLHRAAPKGLNATLRPYQLEGLSWMQSLRQLEVGGILADDMGLGKTLQTLAHILTKKRRTPGPAVHGGDAHQPDPQLARRSGALHAATESGGAVRRRPQKHFEHLADFDLILTTYALLPKDVERLAQQPCTFWCWTKPSTSRTPTAKPPRRARAERAPAPVPERHTAGKPPG